MMLEKNYSKWLSIQPLSEADQNKLSMRFTVEYNYNSNHLEGNTLTYDQTELLLLFPDFVTFSKYVCKCLIISGCFCCLGRRAKSRVK